jgi:hypothetical protein
VSREHFAERLIPRRAQPAELNALVVFIEAQFAEAVVEKRFTPIGAHCAYIESDFPICRGCRRARDERGQPQHSRSVQ